MTDRVKEFYERDSVPTVTTAHTNSRLHQGKDGDLMICYQDMTFCPFYADCQNASTCPRALTPAIQDTATRWWGKPGAPIAVFTEQPDCHKPTENLARD